jgi:hypothetical protein
MLVFAATIGLVAQAGQPGVDSTVGVILSTHQARTALDQCSRLVPSPLSGTWTPDEATVRKLELVLGHALDRALDERIAPVTTKHSSSDYYRQYAGLMIGKKRIIYVNGFTKSSVEQMATAHRQHPEIKEIAWRTRAVVACDGGSTYFGAVFNPATGKIEGIEFNFSVSPQVPL